MLVLNQPQGKKKKSNTGSDVMVMVSAVLVRMIERY